MFGTVPRTRYFSVNVFRTENTVKRFRLDIFKIAHFRGLFHDQIL